MEKKITKLKMMMTIRKIVLTIVLLYSIQSYADVQLDSIPQWINKIYTSKSENLDSFRMEIYKQDNKGISIYQFKNYTDSIFKQDSSLPTMVKTIYVLNVIFKNIDTTLFKQIEYETRYYYYYLMKKMYVFIGAKNFPIYKEDYNNIFTTNHLFPRKMNKDSRTIALIYKYFPIRPQWIGVTQLRHFRHDSIYQYNDLILKYILKSPDSVDFSKYKTPTDGFDLEKDIWFNSINTLAYFDDQRVIPYLEKLGKTVRLIFPEPVYTFLIDSKEDRITRAVSFDNISLRLRLWFMKGMLENKEIFKQISTMNIFFNGIDIIPFDYYIVGEKVGVLRVGFFYTFYPADYEKLTIMKTREEQYKYVQNFIDKKLKELKK